MTKHTTLTSRAKVNITLKVLGKRPDGYHEIHSLMQPITLSDEVSLMVEEGHGVSVTCDHPQVPSDERNLAHRAATLFLTETGGRWGVSIHIKKLIPVAAGLGGGSSNAATVLFGLNELLGARLGEERLMAMGAQLGSDVPFFILQSPAIARGRGELLERIEIPPYWYLLINPGFEVSAAWAYDNLNLTKGGAAIRISPFNLNRLREIGAVDGGMEDFLHNDLEEAVLRAHPEIQAMKDLLHSAGARGTLMSGSGPTVFGLFFNEDKARRALEVARSGVGSSTALFVAQGIA
ncbi:MAG: 4-(cytidine 5'-diphospho)-2-C-methyl-D-erythritol kinase [Deltaproteobacteria bacterium]|nr:4-(cytidine 5'-diphospho)-2-C-methyl-D-erythritol kinase [Deltaproteobacteria bacterium]